MNKSNRQSIQIVKNMSDPFKKEIVQRITRSLLDIQILRLIQTQPMWGYVIKKRIEDRFDVKIRHGALYPLLGSLEKESFLTSRKQAHRGRIRKVYAITQKGRAYTQAYLNIIKEQIDGSDIT